MAGDYDQTVEFLMRFRRWGDDHSCANFYIDMRPIREITPAAAILLAAEFDHWNRTHSRKLRARDATEWDPAVRKLLKEMGFFSLLHIRNEDSFELTPPGMIFLPFQTGADANGRPFLELRGKLEEIVGRMAARVRLFQAVSEAIVNVIHHAYLGNRKRWWMSASVDQARREVTMMVLDHGLGIPATLPAKTFRERFRGYISSIPGFNGSDAAMIAAAVELGRSSAAGSNRGHGLSRDILSFVDRHRSPARLRIRSNRGLYVYEKLAGGTVVSRKENMSVSLNGTFLEWKFSF